MIGQVECIFELFYLNNSEKSVENYHIGKKPRFVWKTIYKVFLKYQNNVKVSFIVLGHRKCIFLPFLIKKATTQ